MLLLCFALMGLSSLRYLEIAAIGLAFAGAMLWTSALRVKALRLRVNMLAVACSVLLPVGSWWPVLGGIGSFSWWLETGPAASCSSHRILGQESHHQTTGESLRMGWLPSMGHCDHATWLSLTAGSICTRNGPLDDYRILDAGAPGWKAVTDRYQIQAIIWRAGISELREVLAKDETFVPVYLDTTAAIYVRRDGVYSHIAAATLQGGSRGRHLNR